MYLGPSRVAAVRMMRVGLVRYETEASFTLSAQPIYPAR